MPTDRSQFIVPAGLELEHGPEGLVIRFPGDVVLDAPLGPRVRLIESRGGDISFGAEVEVDEIIALSGKVTARAGLRVTSDAGMAHAVRMSFCPEALGRTRFT